jgi:endonuclease G
MLNKKILTYLGVPAFGIFALNFFNLVELNDSKLIIHFKPQTSQKIEKVENNEEELLEDKEEITKKEEPINSVKKERNTENEVFENNEKYVTISFEHYELEFNCQRGGYNHFSYTTVRDSGKLDRYAKFSGYEDIGKLCKYDPKRAKLSQNKETYKSPSGYDRGHGVHQNIWDHSEKLMKETNYMINIVPQEAKQNRQGLWRYGEKLTECLRDQNAVYVIGGNIWGNNTENDYFVSTHNVQTPDDLFKIIINGNEVHAWIIPNNDTANVRNSRHYSVSINDIEKAVGYKFAGISDSLRYKKGTTPSLPKGCSIQ